MRGQGVHGAPNGALDPRTLPLPPLRRLSCRREPRRRRRRRSPSQRAVRPGSWRRARVTSSSVGGHLSGGGCGMAGAGGERRPERPDPPPGVRRPGGGRGQSRGNRKKPQFLGGFHLNLYTPAHVHNPRRSEGTRRGGGSSSRQPSRRCHARGTAEINQLTARGFGSGSSGDRGDPASHRRWRRPER